MNIKDFNPKKRFSSKADSYDKYRPTYPQEIIDILVNEYGLVKGDVVADVGSGTGKFTELLIKNGMNVFAVEPNSEMRAYAEKAFSCFPNFTSIDASAEETTLEDSSVDLITVAQAFHWFDKAPTIKEFARILKSSGFVALVWNDRKTVLTDFQKSYDELLVKYCPDYRKVDHKDSSTESLNGFFPGKKITEYHFDNSQSVDLDSMIGRLKSSSYCPLEDNENFKLLIASLKEVFAKYQVNGGVITECDTTLFCISD